jgi:CubicO group peptidase (beta-lactamase class C family)
MFKRLLLPVFCFGLCVNPVIAQESKTNGKVRGESGKKLDAHLTRLVDKGFSGAVFVAKKDKIILAKGYGYADREKRIPVKADTVFPIGSVTKQFTAAAIVKLEMQGKLQVADSITKYFKDVPPDKSKITIHQLLTHSSGIPFEVGSCKQIKTRDEFITMVLNAQLSDEPGTKYKYSNSAYDLLAVIVELAAGVPFEQYLSENLFEPVGMKQTGTFVPKYSLENIAVGYRDGKRWGNVYEKLFRYDYLNKKFFGVYGFVVCGRGAGAILSTVGDLYKWHKQFEGERVFSKAAKEKIFTSYIWEGEEPPSYYGYGWVTQKTARGTRVVWHNGDVNSVFQADFNRYVDEDVVYMLMTNSLYLEQGAVKVSPQIAKIIFDNLR